MAAGLVLRLRKNWHVFRSENVKADVFGLWNEFLDAFDPSARQRPVRSVIRSIGDVTAGEISRPEVTFVFRASLKGQCFNERIITAIQYGLGRLIPHSTVD